MIDTQHGGVRDAVRDPSVENGRACCSLRRVMVPDRSLQKKVDEEGRICCRRSRAADGALLAEDLPRRFGDTIEIGTELSTIAVFPEPGAPVSTKNDVDPSLPPMSNRQRRRASISLMRALTSFLTSVAGRGLPIGKRMVPFETS